MTLATASDTLCAGRSTPASERLHALNPASPCRGSWTAWPQGVRKRPTPRGQAALEGERDTLSGWSGGHMAEQPDSHATIAALIEGLDPGALVTQFVVVAEVIDGNGERCLWVDTHDGASKWDTYGLLTWALNEEAAGQHATACTRLEDDEDET